MAGRGVAVGCGLVLRGSRLGWGGFDVDAACRDGRTLLGAIYAQRGEFAWLRELPQARVLRTVLRQTFLVQTDTRGREVMRRRDANKDAVPPAARMTPTRGGRPRAMSCSGSATSCT